MVLFKLGKLSLGKVLIIGLAHIGKTKKRNDDLFQCCISWEGWTRKQEYNQHSESLAASVILAALPQSLLAIAQLSFHIMDIFLQHAQNHCMEFVHSPPTQSATVPMMVKVFLYN